MANDNYFGNEYVQVGGILCAAQDNVTAAGTTQATAAVLGSQQLVRVATAAASSGVLLPPSQAGAEVVVINSGANAVLVYPSGSEKINALAASAGFSIAANGINIFYCFTAGQWFTK